MPAPQMSVLAPFNFLLRRGHAHTEMQRGGGTSTAACVAASLAASALVLVTIALLLLFASHEIKTVAPELVELVRNVNGSVVLNAVSAQPLALPANATIENISAAFNRPCSCSCDLQCPAWPTRPCRFGCGPLHALR